MNLEECIVFSYEHYNPLGLVRSLGEKNIKPTLIVIRNKIKLTSKSKYVGRIFYVETVTEGYEVLKSLKRNKKSFIFTCDDTITSYLNEKYDELKDYFYFFNSGETGRTNFFMDKKNINDIAKKCGFSVLDYQVIDTDGIVPKNLIYPVVTKAINSLSSGWKNDSFICNTRDELVNCLKNIKSDKVLIQRYIEKKNECCLDGFSVNNGKNVYIAISSSYDYVIPNNYSPLMTISKFNDGELKNKIDNMFKEIGFNGIFSIEFLVSKTNELFFLEVNFRNSTWSYAATNLGMNLPYSWMKRTVDSNFNFIVTDIPDNYKAMVEFDDFRYRVKKMKMISFLKWLKQRKIIKKNGTLFYYNSKDKNPYYSYLLRLVLKKIFRK